MDLLEGSPISVEMEKENLQMEEKVEGIKNNSKWRAILSNFFHSKESIDENNLDPVEPSSSSLIKPLEIPSVLESILKYLDVPSLQLVRRVNSLWNEEARRQILHHLDQELKTEDQTLDILHDDDLTHYVLDPTGPLLDSPKNSLPITTVYISLNDDDDQMSGQLLETFFNFLAPTLKNLNIQDEHCGYAAMDHHWLLDWQLPLIQLPNLERLQVTHDPRTEGWTLFPWAIRMSMVLPKLKSFSTNCCITTKKVCELVQNECHEEKNGDKIIIKNQTLEELDVHLTPDTNFVQIHRMPAAYLNVFQNLKRLTAHIEINESLQVGVVRVFDFLENLQHLSLKFVGWNDNDLAYCDEILTGLKRRPNNNKKIKNGDGPNDDFSEQLFNEQRRTPCVRQLQNLKSLEIYYYKNDRGGPTDFSIYHCLIHLKNIQRLYIQQAQFSSKAVKYLKNTFWPTVNIELVHCIPEMRYQEVSRRPQFYRYHVDHTFELIRSVPNMM